MRQKVYYVKTDKQGKVHLVPNTKQCRAVPKSVLLVQAEFRKKNGLSLRFPFGNTKFNEIITDEDVRDWSKEQRYPMLCSKSKSYRYVCAFATTHSHTHTTITCMRVC